MRRKVLFKAPALTFSGYGVHARQVCRYLMDLADAGEVDLYIELTRWGNTPWALRDDIFDGLVARVRKYFRPTVDSNGQRMKFDVSVQLLLPNEWTVEPGAFNVGMTAAVESDRANPLWAPACDAMDMVVVPSSHAARAMATCGETSTPVHVVPESYIEALDRPPADVDFGFSTSFNFLVVGQLTSHSPGLDRKNMFGTVKAICDAFPGDEDVGIVLKTNAGRGTKIDRQVTYDKFRQLVGSVRKGQFPRLHIIHGDMEDAEMVALYKDPSVKAFVSLTRGEGFGLPILEAAVAGLPVVATNWSGHLDFMSRGKFIKVDYELQPIPGEKVDRHGGQDAARNIWVDGSRWACPREKNAVKALQKFRQSHEIPTRWAQELSVELRSAYSYAAVRDMYDALLGPVLRT